MCWKIKEKGILRFFSADKGREIPENAGFDKAFHGISMKMQR